VLAIGGGSIVKGGSIAVELQREVVQRDQALQ